MKLKALKSFIGLCAIFLQLSQILTTPAYAGGMDGGGGGAYRLDDGRLVTLPEFGVLIKDSFWTVQTTGKKYDKYYKISGELRSEVKSLLHFLKLRVPNFMLYEGLVIPNAKSVFISRENVDPKEYKKIKGEYREVLASFGYKLEEDKFVLPAVSIGNKTYIFPDFHQLTTSQQAKYLIHEYLMRKNSERKVTSKERVERLKLVLQVDTLIEKLITSPPNTNVDPLQLAKVFYSQSLILEDGVFQGIFQAMLDEMKTTIDVKDFTSFFDTSDSLSLDPSVLQELQDKHQLKRNYAEIFEGTSITFNLIDYEDILKSDKVCLEDNADYFKNIHLNIYNPYMTYLVECRKQRATYYQVEVLNLGPFLKKLIQ